ncbi:MAG: Clp protease ClpP [Desulfurellales bacterium]|nr:MAG: Clp protease ClpP [Desulfurellales bacterium]
MPELVRIDLAGPITAYPMWPEDVSARDIVAKLAQAGGAPVEVHINSPGGDAYEGMAICNALRSYKGDTSCVIDGLCASAATMAALGCGKVRMHEMAFFMIHEAASFAGGFAEDLESVASWLRKINARLTALYVAKTGKSEAEIAAWMAAETWFPPAEAKAAGFVDEVITAPVAPTAYAAFGRVLNSYRNVPAALTRASAPAATARPLPKLPVALAQTPVAATPKRTPMERKTLLANLLGALALASDMAQAAADSPDPELSEMGRQVLDSNRLPACVHLVQPIAQKDSTEPTNYAEAQRVYNGAVKVLGSQSPLGALDALKAKADNGSFGAVATLDAELITIKAEAVRDNKLTPAECDAYAAQVKSGARSVDDYRAFVKLAVKPLAKMSGTQIEGATASTTEAAHPDDSEFVAQFEAAQKTFRLGSK